MTASWRRLIKHFVKAKLDAIRKNRADKHSQKKIAQQIAKQSEPKPLPKGLWALVAVAPFVVLVGVAMSNYLSGDNKPLTQEETLALANNEAKLTISSSVKIDEVTKAGVVASVAETANLPVASHASNVATSIEIEASSSQKADPTLNKPEIVSLDGVRQGIKLHIVQEGETLQQLAASNNISENTIKWANNMTNDAVNPGDELRILPVDGVYYNIKINDTYDSIVAHYGSSQEQIIAINNLEISGLVPGNMIIIPDGILPETERPGYVRPRSTQPAQSIFAYRGAAYNGNTYARGYCTWYAYNRYAELNGRAIPSSWGHARTWDDGARATPGFTVSSVPTAGAIFQRDGGLGHVGIVESVNYNEDGSVASINISDMNGVVGWGRVGYATLSDWQKYDYIK